MKTPCHTLLVPMYMMKTSCPVFARTHIYASAYCIHAYVYVYGNSLSHFAGTNLYDEYIMSNFSKDSNIYKYILHTYIRTYVYMVTFCHALLVPVHMMNTSLRMLARTHIYTHAYCIYTYAHACIWKLRVTLCWYRYM